MDWLFFLFSVLCFALAYNVVKPIYHHPRYMIYSFLFGWLTGELALHVLLVQVLVFALVVWLGELKGGLDAISVVLCLGAWAMLMFHAFTGFAAAKPKASKLNFMRLARPVHSLKNHGLCVDKNISYRQVDGLNLKLDIWRTEDALKNKPVLFQIHGGGWTKGYGSKNEQAIPLMQALARQGWVCVSINYRLSPKATFPDHIIDCKHALAWVKEHIADFGGNPEYIVASGGSAGGHLCSLLALSAQVDVLNDGLNKDMSVQGCVPFYGIYDVLDEQKLQHSVGLDIVLRKSIIKQTKQENEALYRLMSPITHISEHAPPFLIVHGDKDTLTSFEEAEYFANALTQCSKRQVSFVAIAGGQHAFDMFPSIRSEFVLERVLEVLETWHQEFQERSRSEAA